jgi:hypothetical protein
MTHQKVSKRPGCLTHRGYLKLRCRKSTVQMGAARGHFERATATPIFAGTVDTWGIRRRRFDDNRR